METIGAISTGMGGAISVIRISGPKSRRIIEKLFPGSKIKYPRRVYYGDLIFEGETIDRALFFFMEKGASYTGEEMAEISCHGGVKNTSRVLEAVLKAGVRLAEPGEFTKRAFLNGKMDLTEAEAVIDIINAKTELSRKSAAHRHFGGLLKRVTEMEEEILSLLAPLEAAIDYPDEELETIDIWAMKAKINALMERLNSLIGSANSGIILKEGIDAVILGRPNGGKSSLLNALLGEERSIVTDIPGTTRDIISEYADILGLPVKLHDTAGIRQSGDIIESAGVERAIKRGQGANLLLYVISAAEGVLPEDLDVISKINPTNLVIIYNKIDIGNKTGAIGIDAPVVEISALTGQGIDCLLQTIYNMFLGEIPLDGLIIDNERNKQSLEGAVKSLKNVLDSIDKGMGDDIISIDLTETLRRLGEITGRFADKSIIDNIFSRFCLGK